ncbi:MAG: phosphotransferase [Actinomycetales bacterium]|nr:phosphotransferase [Actinomycetales bacterium]
MPDGHSGVVSIMRHLPPADAVRLSALPCLAEVDTIVPLPGGITNRNYRARGSKGDFVIRVSDPDSTILAIDRVNELRNSLAAAYAGIGAPVVDFMPDAGLLVVGWIESRTLGDSDIRDPQMLARIASACRQLHAGPRFAGDFDMFDIQARYLTLVQTNGWRLPAGYLDYLPELERMRAALACNPEPTVPCHNDLLAANFLDDGARLWIIDYEFSGNNEASFELGNIWSEAMLAPDLLELLADAYWGKHSPEKIARARLWGLMAKYGWTLWASIQVAVSQIDFDYWSWGMEKYEGAVAEFNGPDYPRLLAQVATKG